MQKLKSFFVSAIIISFGLLNLSLNTAQADAKPVLVTASATVLPQPRSLNPFTLTGSDHKPFTNKNLQGHWTLMYFGFTRCTTICPMALNTLQAVYAKLKADNKPLPQVVFVSIDPKRDTVADVQRYVTSFNPNFQGVVGDAQQLAQLTHDLSVLYLSEESGDNNAAKQQDYQIDHSGTITLIDPQGKFHAVFSMPHQPMSIAQDIEKICA